MCAARPRVCKCFARARQGHVCAGRPRVCKCSARPRDGLVSSSERRVHGARHGHFSTSTDTPSQSFRAETPTQTRPRVSYCSATCVWHTYLQARVSQCAARPRVCLLVLLGKVTCARLDHVSASARHGHVPASCLQVSDVSTVRGTATCLQVCGSRVCKCAAQPRVVFCHMCVSKCATRPRVGHVSASARLVPISARLGHVSPCARRGRVFASARHGHVSSIARLGHVSARSLQLRGPATSLQVRGSAACRPCNCMCSDTDSMF